MKKRLVAPDFIKGLAIVLMVFGHIAAIGSGAEIHKKVVDVIYTFHMPLFLIISGYFFYLKDDSFKNQILKQIKNIGIPYIIFITIYLSALLLVYKFTSINTSNKPPLVFADFIYTIFIHPMGGYWFLHSVLIISILFIICNFLTPLKEDSTVFLLSVWCSILIVSTYFNLVSVRTCLYFFMGFTLANFAKVQMQNPTKMIVFGSVIMLLAYSLQSRSSSFNIFEILWCWGIFVILWAVPLIIENTVFVKLFCWFGRNTLVILVLHTFFLLLFKIIKNPFLSIDSTGFLYSTMTTIFTIILSLFSAKFFDYINISRFLFGKEAIYSKYKINHD